MPKTRSLLILILVSVLALPALAADKKKGNRKPPGKGKNPAQNTAPAHPVLNAAFGDTYRKINLNPQQYGKLVELVQEFGPKVAKAQAEIDGNYTKEQLELKQRSLQMAIRAGVPSERLEMHVERTTETFELSDEQKEKLAVAQAAFAKLKAEFRGEASAFLAKEQVGKLMGESSAKPAVKKKN